MPRPGAVDALSLTPRCYPCVPISSQTRLLTSCVQKNLNDDGRRTLQVRKHVAAPGHCYRKFGTGNLVTLRDRPAAAGLNIRNMLIAHHKQHYAAGLMTLAVLGRQSLDELRALVTGGGPFGTDFSAVPDNGAPVPVDKSAGHPYSAGHTARAVLVPPVRDIRTITLVWPAPDAPVPNYSHTSRLVSHLLGHEGPGSVLALLKERGWASSLSAGGSAYRHFSTFEVSVSLTPDGLAHADDVIATIYRYIRVLRTASAEELQLHWVEMQQVARNGLRFRAQQAPVSAVTAIATALSHYPAPDVLVAGSLVCGPFDHSAVAGTLSLLMPSNMLLLRSAREDYADASTAAPALAPGALAGLEPHEEPAYGFTYYAAALSSAQVMLWDEAGGCAAGAMPSAGSVLPEQAVLAQAKENGWALAPVTPPVHAGSLSDNEELNLPRPNDFLPSDFTLRPIVRMAAGSGAHPSDAHVSEVSETVEVPDTVARIEPPAEPIAHPVASASQLEAAQGVQALSLADEAPPSVAAASENVDVIVTPAADADDAPVADAMPVQAALSRDLTLPPHPLDGALNAAFRPLRASAGSITVKTKYPEPQRVRASAAAASNGGALPLELWHAQDNTFRLPKTIVQALLTLPSDAPQGASARNRVLASLFASCLNDRLGEVTYAAEVAGLQYDLASSPDASGLSLLVSGFSHKLPALLARVCSAIADFEGTMGGPARFAAVFARRSDALRRALLNNAKAQPYTRARQLVSEYTTSIHFTPEQSLQALAGISQEDLRAHAATALRSGEGGASLLALVYGNVTLDDSAAIGSALASGLSGGSRLKGGASPVHGGASAGTSARDDAFEPRVLLLPAGTEHVLTRVHPNPSEPNAAVHTTWQLGAATPRTLATVSLFGMLVSQPSFDRLRTKEQLGYMVFSGAEAPMGAGAGFTITVQSANASVAHLQSRIDSAVESFRDLIAGMSEEDVAAKAAILAHRLTEADKTQNAEAGRLWGPLATRTLDFHSAESAAAVLTSGGVTRESLLALLDQCMLPGAPLLRKLVARVYSQRGPSVPGGETAASSEAPAAVPAALHGGGPAMHEPHPRELRAPAPEFKSSAVAWDRHVAEGSSSSASDAGVWLPTARFIASQSWSTLR